MARPCNCNPKVDRTADNINLFPASRDLALGQRIHVTLQRRGTQLTGAVRRVYVNGQGVELVDVLVDSPRTVVVIRPGLGDVVTVLESV